MTLPATGGDMRRFATLKPSTFRSIFTQTQPLKLAPPASLRHRVVFFVHMTANRCFNLHVYTHGRPEKLRTQKHLFASLRFSALLCASLRPLLLPSLLYSTTGTLFIHTPRTHGALHATLNLFRVPHHHAPARFPSSTRFRMT